MADKNSPGAFSAVRLGGLIHIQHITRRFAAPDTLQEALWLFMASSIGSFFNYLYHFLMGRMLGPAQYAALASLIGVLALLSAPFGVSQAVLADFTARLLITGGAGQVRHLLVAISRRLGLLVLLSLAAMLLASPWIAGFLRLSSSGPLIVLAFVLALSIMTPAASGAVQGWQDFRGLSWVGLISGAGRLGGGFVLVLLGLGVVGAIGGFAVAAAMTVGVLVLLLRRRLASAVSVPSGVTAMQVVRYAAQIGLATLALALLTNADVVLARHFFPSEQAGYYSAAATLGKIAFFVPGPVSALMFPKVSARHAVGGQSGSVVRRTAIAVAGLSLGVTGLFFALPELMVRLLYGSAYGPTAGLIGPYGLAMTGYALAMLLMTYYLARHDWRYIGLMLGFGAAQAAAMATLPLGAAGYVAVMAATAWGLVLTSEVWLGGLRGA